MGRGGSRTVGWVKSEYNGDTLTPRRWQEPGPVLAALRLEVVGITLTPTLEKNQGSERFCNSFRVTQLRLEDQDPCLLALEPVRGTPVP